MASTPWFALYPSDYLADTAHLGLTEHGVYWRLLLHYYQHGQPIPGDLERPRGLLVLAGSPEERRTVEYILTEYFVLTTREDGTRAWVHRRAEREIEHARMRSEAFLKRVEEGRRAGAKSAESRRQKYGSAQPTKTLSAEGALEAPAEGTFERTFEGTPQGTPEQSTSTSTSTERQEEKSRNPTWAIPADAGMTPDTVEECPPTPKPNGKHTYPPAFESAWADYPKRAGGNPKPAALKAWNARMRQGVSPEDLHAGVRRYAAFIRATGKEGTEYVKQAASFFGPDRHWEEPWSAPSPSVVLGARQTTGGQVGYAAEGDW